MRLSLLKKLSFATGTYKIARTVHRHVFDRKRLADAPIEIALYKRLIPKGSLCFDVGANIGDRAEALLQAGCKVVAFEPQEHCARELSARCGAYSGITILKVAVGESPAVASLFVRALSGQSGLVSEWEGTTTASVDVPVLTLDIAIAKYGLPFYCKIDVEGYELQVLKGLTSSIPIVSIEYHVEEADLAKTMACVAKLRELQMRFVNVSLAETPALHYRNWRPLETFETWFPRDLAEHGLPSYGDLWFSTRNLWPEV